MKKARRWITALTFLAAIITWGIMGVKLFDGNHDIMAEACVMGACMVLLILCALSKCFTDRCPHCGKMRVSNGKFCPYCGKEL